MPKEALTAFTVSDAYRQFAGQTELLRSESWSRIKYLIRTNYIIVLDSHFKFTNKCYLIHRLRYDLIRFFVHLVIGSGLLFGPLCRMASLSLHVKLQYDTAHLCMLHAQTMFITFNRYSNSLNAKLLYSKKTDVQYSLIIQTNRNININKVHANNRLS